MSDSMNSTPPGAVDDKFAPLKRNHACLQCKKRKVKCDAIHPTCSPCMRSYHHAARAAQRNKSELPVLVCTYAEVDSNPGSEDEMPILIRSGEEKRKKRSRDANPAQTRHRDDDIGMETEREALMARIAELEHRLNGLTPTDSIPSRPSSSGPRKPTTPSRAFDETTAWLQGALTSNPKGQNPPVHVSQPIASQATIPASIAPNLDAFDFGSYFLVPMHWPPGLPSPFLLEHLIETFFNSVPHFGRILHRASLLARVRLPPTSPDFPHASLLHSICATAATHTAWVNNVPAEAMEEMLLKNQFLKTSLEISEDFALMQGDLAEKSMKQAASLCMMGPGNTMLEIAQASTILAEVYYNKSLPMQGWIISAFGPRLLHALELMNKNRANSVKEPLLTEPRDTFDREQRIATVWATFIVDAGFALNSFWAGSIDFAELLTPFPASTIHFHSKDDSIPPNPQTAFTPDMLTHHPVQDPFALACKASTLTWRSAKWIRTWTQRDQVPGDTLNGLARPDFMELIKDITGFQASIPVSMKNLFKILDQSSGQSFDADILMIHIMPNLSLALIYEAMLDWDNPNPYCVQQIQKAFEGIIGVLYLIPTNLDVSLVLTSLLAFSIYTTGRILSNFIQHAIGAEQFTVAMRYRADLQTCQNVLSRYGQKHALGLMMSKFLEAYISVPARNLRASNQCISQSEFQAWAEGEIAMKNAGHRDSQSSGPSTGSTGQVPRTSAIDSSAPGSTSSGITPPVIQTVTPESSGISLIGDPSGKTIDQRYPLGDQQVVNFLGVSDEYQPIPNQLDSAAKNPLEGVKSTHGPAIVDNQSFNFSFPSIDPNTFDPFSGADKVNQAFGMLPVGEQLVRGEQSESSQRWRNSGN